MASKAKPLKEELKKRFYPWVKSKGFHRQKGTDPHVVEFRRELPGREEIFDIQWDKYWRPYFVVNFEKRGSNEEDRAACGRLQRRRGSSISCWFSPYPPLSSRIAGLRWRYEPRDVVDELMEAFGELETWWRDGRVGPRIYILDYHV